MGGGTRGKEKKGGCRTAEEKKQCKPAPSVAKALHDDVRKPGFEKFEHTEEEESPATAAKISALLSRDVTLSLNQSEKHWF